MQKSQLILCTADPCERRDPIPSAASQNALASSACTFLFASGCACPHAGTQCSAVGGCHDPLHPTSVPPRLHQEHSPHLLQLLPLSWTQCPLAACCLLSLSSKRGTCRPLAAPGGCLKSIRALCSQCRYIVMRSPVGNPTQISEVPARKQCRSTAGCFTASAVCLRSAVQK